MWLATENGNRSGYFLFIILILGWWELAPLLRAYTVFLTFWLNRPENDVCRNTLGVNIVERVLHWILGYHASILKIKAVAKLGSYLTPLRQIKSEINTCFSFSSSDNIFLCILTL